MAWPDACAPSERQSDATTQGSRAGSPALWALFFEEGKQSARNGMLRRAPLHIASAWERAAWLAGWCRGFVEITCVNKEATSDAAAD